MNNSIKLIKKNKNYIKDMIYLLWLLMCFAIFLKINILYIIIYFFSFKNISI